MAKFDHFLIHGSDLTYYQTMDLSLLAWFDVSALQAFNSRRRPGLRRHATLPRFCASGTKTRGAYLDLGMRMSTILIFVLVVISSSPDVAELIDFV